MPIFYRKKGRQLLLKKKTLLFKKLTKSSIDYLRKRRFFLEAATRGTTFFEHKGSQFQVDLDKEELIISDF
jgi:hypothetical protein